MASDPFAEFGGAAYNPASSAPVASAPVTTPVSAPSAPSASSDDPFAEFGGRSFTPSQQQTIPQPQTNLSNDSVTTPSSSGSTPAPSSGGPDPFAEFGGRSFTPSAQTVQLSGQSGQLPTEPAPDQNLSWFDRAWQGDSFMGRVWNALNTPILDVGHAVGRDQAVGFEKGLYDIASGLTSPLSILLTIGTMGTGGFIESGGAAALKAAGLAAEDINAVTKGAEIATKAFKAGKDEAALWQDVANAGLDVNKVKSGIATLKAQGLDENALAEAGWIHRSGALALRKTGLSPVAAEKVSTGVQTLINAGFTAQNAYAAAVVSPRILDALKDGEYDKAAELATNAAASGLLATVGLKPTLREAGMLLDDALVKGGIRVTPHVQNSRVANVFGKYDRAVETAGSGGKLDEAALRKKYSLSAADYDRVINHVEAGLDDTDMARRGNWLAEAAGLPKPYDTPPVYTIGKGTPLENAPAVSDYPIFADGKRVGHARISIQDGDAQVGWLGPDDRKAGQPINLGVHGVRDLIGQFKQDHPEVESFQGKRLSGIHANGFGHGAQSIPAHASAERVMDQARIRELVDQGLVGKNYTLPEAKSLVDSYDPSKLTDNMRSAAKEIRDYLSQSLEMAQKGGVLKEGVRDYMTHIWEKPEEGDPRLWHDIEHDGDFDANTSMALRRSFMSAFEGQLMGRKLKVRDPIALAAFNRVGILRAIAAREAENSLRDQGLRASDGRPAVAPSGYGETVSGYDGSNPAVFVNPNGKPSIQIANQDIEAMRKSGDLDRFLKSGQIVVVGHEYVHPTTGIRMSERAANLSPETEALQRHYGRAGSGQNYLDYLTELRAVAEKKLPSATPFVERAEAAFNDGDIRKAKTASESALNLLASADKTNLETGPNPAALLNHPGRIRKDETTVNPTAVNPDNVEYLTALRDAVKEKVPDEVQNVNKALRALVNNGDLAHARELSEPALNALSTGTERFKRPVYAWDTHDFRTIDHPSFNDWTYVASDTKGQPVMVKAPLRVHPEFYDYISRRMEPSAVRGIPGAKAVLGASREAKGALLSLSPFHAMQEALRALMSGVMPVADKFDLRTDDLLGKLVEHDLTLNQNYRHVSDFQDGLGMAGHSKLISKIPVFGKLQDGFQNWLFKEYIPGLKARAAKDLYARYKARYEGKWTEDKILRTAARDANERFGGINYKQLGRSKELQDMSRIFALAPDWLESELRFMGRLASPEGKIARFDFARAALALWGGARVLNYLTTGNFHNEAPFGLVLKDENGKDKVYSVRTLPTDLLHAASDPFNFLKGRTAPLVRSGVEAYTGRDEYGRALPTHNLISSLFNNSLPIGVQNISKSLSGENTNLTNFDQMLKAGGLTVYPSRTEAYKKASELASSHAPSGPVNDSQIMKHQVLMHLEDELRAGRIQPQDLGQAVTRGALSQADARAAINNFKITRDLAPDVAQLYVRASRLPFPELVQVYDLANQKEKNALAPLMLKSKKAYVKSAMTKMTPMERMNDPVLARITKMFPNGVL